jgi:hypothetical protein
MYCMGQDKAMAVRSLDSRHNRVQRERFCLAAVLQTCT